MDTTVALGSTSVNVCNTCATHSLPAFALKAYWKSDVACSTFLAICFTSLRMMSPTTAHLTPHQVCSRGSNSNGVTCCAVATSSLNGSLGTGGLRSGSVSALNVVRSPTVNPPMLVGLLTTLPTAPTAKLEMLCLEHHQDGAIFCA